MKHLLTGILFCLGLYSVAQDIRLAGNVNDTSASTPLPNVLLMAVRFTDSTLVNYARTGRNGFFKPITVPRDTYLVIISHPSFSDRTYLLVPGPKDTAFSFNNITLPPKSTALSEVEIIAHREKSYYRGDTLTFTADSFKTKANATVEDLLKKLPGFRVDAAGKITIQGKEVDRVLVDGDEFFGTDPTVATRNLNAASIANVQVYEKKNESTEEGKSETLKVLNLQMKDGAKNGYFGKASVARDVNRFYENELLLNRFKGNRKYSVFGLLANTPKQAFGGSDVFKYGLDGERQWQYDETTGGYNSTGTQNTGIPQTVKSGVYFNDKLGKKTKLNTDYTFNESWLHQGIETNTQFFLPDTAYRNAREKRSDANSQGHNFNLTFVQKIDSLTEITIAPKIKYNQTKTLNFQTDDFISSEGVNTRNTTLSNQSAGTTLDANVLLKASRNFMKKDRNLTLTWQPSMNRTDNTSSLVTRFTYFQRQLPDSQLIQQRKQTSDRDEQAMSASYTEPWSKKFKTEITYYYSSSRSSSSRNTFDFNGSAYDIFNPLFSNSFQNLRNTNRGGIRFIYDVKKYRVSLGGNVRNIAQQNTNRSNGNKLSMDVTQALPQASFQYRINQGSNLQITYAATSQLPDLQQMQPVIDNTDPNRLSLGNPNLRPSFTNQVNVNYYLFKAVSDFNLWAGGSYNATQDQFSSSVSYDSQGRAVSLPVNVNGSYFSNVYVGGGFPLLKKFFKIYYNLSTNTSNMVSFTNGKSNVTRNTSSGASLNLEKDAEKFEVGIGGNYRYYQPSSSISTSATQPYYTYGLDGSVQIKLPAKFILASDAAYTNNGNRSPGYNLNYLIWNATLAKGLLKTGNLVFSINVYDILNQNISNQRNVMGNQIVDTKTQIIKRYFLLKLLYKFNNQKTKVENDDDY